VVSEDVELPAAAVADSTQARRGRARAIVATVVGIVAVLVLVVAIVGVWARATVMRAEPVAELVGDAIAEPEVQAALAEHLADQVATAVDLEARLSEALPARLARFAPAIAAGANATVERALVRLLGRDEVQRLVTTVVERAHGRAMRLLQGDGLVDGFTVADGEVSVNLLPLVARGLTALQQSTPLLDRVEIPELTADGDAEEQAAALSAALGRDLPDGFGQLVVYRSESVARAQEAVQSAQRIFVLAKRALWALVIGAVVLIAVTILVSPRRWRATLVLALGTAAAMVLLRTTVRQVVDGAGDMVRRPGARAAVEAIVSGAATTLLRLAGIVLIVALAAVAVAMLRRRAWRDDLVLTAAVVVGAAVVAVLGVGLWSLIAGVVVGVALPFAVRWLWPTPAAPPATA
jgi:hypothetical protein